ncbi:MAG: hypothetical protein HW378_1784, partial [Anaerolineales bacterium]|nr:hypothetical protein [Anaerolineales bacterium]
QCKARGMSVVYSRAQVGDMKKYAHLRAKAQQLRQKGATLTEICEQLSLGKSTVYGWIKGIPIPRTARQSEQRRKAAQAIRQKHEALRHQWYDEAYQTAPEVLSDPVMRDFVVLYAAEGFKRDRNRVELCNSNPNIMRVAHRFIGALSRNPHIRYRLQCHVDNDEGELKAYWSQLLGIETQNIKIMRKSNAGEMRGRNWRSLYGVLTIEVGDTRLRCMIQAWMDYLQCEWSRS